MHVYQEQQLNAYFSYGSVTEAFPAGTRQRLEYYTILLCQDGRCGLRADTTPVALEARTVLTLSPGALLDVDRVSGCSMHCFQFNREFYCIEFHDAEVSCNGLLFNAATQAPRIRIPEEESGGVALLLQMFEKEFDNTDRLQLEMLRVLLKRLIITCTRLVKQQLESDRNLRVAQTDTLRMFSALVDKHFRDKHKVTDYARMMNKSPKTLSNLFLRYSSQSALQVIHERIALEARRLIIQSECSAKEVAFELGFTDPAQFNRFFKRMTGQTTQEFRVCHDRRQ
jgi:AraC-like DNA-binding protein